MRPQTVKKIERSQKEMEVLIGLIDHYLLSGKPVGSHTLKDAGFDHLSSATIRNYFVKLEEDGYLEQLHTSGGRIPTEKAYRFYAEQCKDRSVLEEKALREVAQLKKISSKEIAKILRTYADKLSHFADSAVFISSPRFEQDFITDIKVLPIDTTRCLFAIVTDFGSVQTEILPTKEKMTSFSAKRIEQYLHARLTGQENLQPLEPEEELFAKEFYNEIVLRFLASYTNFMEEDLYWHGFSKLLHYPDFHDPAILAESLALFENSMGMRHLVRDTLAHNELKCWVGSDLSPFAGKEAQATVIAIPYKIHQQPVGAIGVLGPMRLPYRKLFGLLEALSDALSECLTNNLYKFKLSFRQPEPLVKRIEHKPIKLIEHRTK
ncbi:MAG: heat-inducible transcriptional repressor HrcA [Parachlamydiaceae bacterium]